MEDTILQYTYPRLDAEVSKHRNHLLKAPFCIHPKTGRVCVPVDPDTIEDFNPERVPTVGQLLRELDEVGANTSSEGAERHSGTGNSIPSLGRELIKAALHVDWQRTSLKPYVDMLDRHVAALMDEVRRGKREAGPGQCRTCPTDYRILLTLPV